MTKTILYKSIVRPIAIAAVGLLLASTAQATVLKDIQVEGNNRIEGTTIVSNSELSIGKDASPADLDEAVRKLFDTGYFADVRVDLKGNVAVIKIEENPIVNRVYFEGNKQFDDETLAKQIRLQPRQIYTVAKLKQDTKTIHDMLRVKGHFGAKVTPKIVRKDQNRVDIVFEFVEGGATKVANIIFVGNKHVSATDLKRIINTKESKWWRFFSTDDNYDPDRQELDKQLLRRHYLDNGYVDFQVKSAVAELTPDQQEFFITYTLEEGDRYEFGKVDVDVKVPKIDPVKLKSEIVIREGDWYNTKDLDKSITGMTEYLGSHGYAFVDIKPQINQDRENKRINITFEVMEGPKSHINRILITGNVRTNEDVIRRELLVYEGDAYNSYNIKRSKERATNLGFFKEVKITERPAEASDKVDLIVDVQEEESTGELWVAGGYSTAEGPLANIGIKENNLMGKGQSGHLQATVSKKRSQIDLGFVEPHFLNRNIQAGFDIFHINSKQYFHSTFESQRTGLNLKLGYELAEYLTQAWTYSIQYDHISDVKRDTSIFIIDQPRKSSLSALSHKLQYDRRDSRFDPSSGYFIGMTNTFAGLGGTVKYYSNELNGSFYYSLAESWVLSFTGSGGVMHGWGGKTVRIADRFTMGGDGSLRGFREDGAESRDKRTLDPLGGLKYYLGTVELQVPLEFIGVPNDFGIKSHLFSDVGAAWGRDFSQKALESPLNEGVFSSSSPRVSAGVGISWRSPLGPLRIDFAQHLKTKHYDKHKTIHFGFFMGK